MSGVSLPNGCARARAVGLLAAYDERRGGGYKNQQIAARDAIRRATGMSVRDLRRWLKENPPSTPPRPECWNGGSDWDALQARNELRYAVASAIRRAMGFVEPSAADLDAADAALSVIRQHRLALHEEGK